MTGTRTNTLAALLAVMCFWTTSSGPAYADVTVYFDRAEWEAAVGSFTTIDFTGFPATTEIDDQYADQGVLFPELGDFISLSPVTFPNDGAGISNPTGEIFTTYDTPLYALAADYPGILRFQLYSAGEIIYESPYYGGGPLFVGLLSDVSFDAAIIESAGGGNGTIDDLHFSTIPAPGALGLLAAGWLVGGRRRRRR